MYQRSTPAARCARSARLPPLVTAHRSPALCSSFIPFLTLDKQGPHFFYAIEPSLRYTFLETVISPKGRKPLLHRTTLEATPAVHTAGTLWVVIDNPSPAVKLQVTTFQQHLSQLLSRPLDTRFSAGEREAKSAREFLLRESLVFRQNQCLPVGIGQTINHPLEGKSQHTLHIILIFLFREIQSFSNARCNPLIPVIIIDGVASYLVDPALQFVPISEHIYMCVDFDKNVLQDILGALLIADTFDDKLFEFYIELLPHVLRSDDHYQNLPLP